MYNVANVVRGEGGGEGGGEGERREGCIDTNQPIEWRDHSDSSSSV